MDGLCCGPGYASPSEAIQAPREKLLYTIAIYTGTGIQKPDYLATIDIDPDSKNYSKVIHRLEMPGIGDELHHMGWNACSSCHSDEKMSRKYLLVPGVRSNNIYVVDTATNPLSPSIYKIIDGSEIKSKTNLSGPHTVHCLGSEIIISFLGDARGEAPGGYLHLNKDFEIQGRWENSMGDIPFSYDFWYQPRHNVMISSEWAAPNTFMPGFDLEEVGHLKYGRRLHIWDFEKKKPIETMYLGEDGLIPLEVKFLHDPNSSHGFCGAALSTNVIHFWKSKEGKWEWEKIIDVDNEPHPDWPIPIPGVMSAILVSMDDKYLYINNWLHGDMRQYNISDPHKPVLTWQIWIGGLLDKAPVVNGVKIAGGAANFTIRADYRTKVSPNLFVYVEYDIIADAVLGDGYYEIPGSLTVTSVGFKKAFNVGRMFQPGIFASYAVLTEFTPTYSSDSVETSNAPIQAGIDLAFKFGSLHVVPQVSFNYSKLDSCILPSNYSFTNTSSGATSYLWTFDTIANSIQNNPFFSFNDDGIYQVTLIANNSLGCSDSVINYINAVSYTHLTLPTNREV